MKETEITVQVFDELEDIDKKLKDQGFNMIENYQLNDWYFTHLKNIDGIKYQELLNNSILIREIVDDNPQIQLVFKKKELDDFGNVITEEKTKVNVSDLSKCLAIFQMAGFNNYATVKNNSYVYQKENISFVVQVIENLGIFIEYEEDETMREMVPTQKFEYMSSILKGLGLELGQDFSCKKVYMLLKKIRASYK